MEQLDKTHPTGHESMYMYLLEEANGMAYNKTDKWRYVTASGA